MGLPTHVSDPPASGPVRRGIVHATPAPHRRNPTGRETRATTGYVPALANPPPPAYSGGMCLQSFLVSVLVATGVACAGADDESTATAPMAAIRIESAATSTAKNDPAAELIQAAVAADIQRTAALVAADTKALDTLCGDELIFGHADGRIQSKAELLASLSAGDMRYFAINPGQRDVRLLAEAVALVFGSAELLVGTADNARPLKIRYLAVYRFDARLGWRLTAYQSSLRTSEE